MFKLNSALIVILTYVMTAYGATQLVPGQYPTIQAGINAASDGDTVLVSSGTYTGAGNRNIDFSGKSIMVISTNGPYNTIIDIERSGRGFIFQSGESESSVMEGFQIINGEVPDEQIGGGIVCIGASPTIHNNIISDCQAFLGGGIALYYSSPTISQNQIINNIAERGGGIICYIYSQAFIIENIISGNQSEGG